MTKKEELILSFCNGAKSGECKGLRIEENSLWSGHIILAVKEDAVVYFNDYGYSLIVNKKQDLIRKIVTEYFSNILDLREAPALEVYERRYNNN